MINHCHVDIYTEEVKDVVAVPIQCVTVREKVDPNKKKLDKKTTGSSGTADSDVNIEFDEVVFLMDADTAKMIKVETGIQDDEYIMIKSGVNAGDNLISGPYAEISKSLKSGDKVRKKEEKEDKKKE